VLLPFRAEPTFDIRHPIEKAMLEVEQRARERGLETRDHAAIVARRAKGNAQVIALGCQFACAPIKKRAPLRAPE
jgi:hypothetical protein